MLFVYAYKEDAGKMLDVKEKILKETYQDNNEEDNDDHILTARLRVR